MSQVFQNLPLKLDEELEEKLQLLSPGFQSYRILRESVDARKARALRRILTVEVFGPGEEPPIIDLTPSRLSGVTARPIIVGSGPAGLFAAIRFVERGVPCVLLERGSPAEKRILAINRYWRYGELNEDDNVCFGEGGAGLYSDGKLITRIKSPYIPYVMDRLVRFGAPEEIRYLANPHVGSDKIRRVIPKIRRFLIERGCEIHFNTHVEKLLVQGNRVSGVQSRDGRQFRGDHVILATGHSATDILRHLRELEVAMEGKSFAVGLRVEHPQAAVNQIQYREFAEHPKLGAANYKLTYNDDERGVGVYSFCMCPGGYVLTSSTEAGHVVSNGMSNYNRGSPYANSAIVVTVDHPRLFGADAFGGIHYRDRLETQAFEMVREKGGFKELPGQRLIDFLGQRSSELAKNSSLSGAVPARLDRLFSPAVNFQLIEAFHDFHKKMHGFIHPEAQLFGVESRTSCPVRIVRDPESLASTSHQGLYPTGEGAGYAGGITSAACDGIRVAEAICSELASQPLSHEQT